MHLVGAVVHIRRVSPWSRAETIVAWTTCCEAKLRRGAGHQRSVSNSGNRPARWASTARDCRPLPPMVLAEGRVRHPELGGRGAGSPRRAMHRTVAEPARPGERRARAGQHWQSLLGQQLGLVPEAAVKLRCSGRGDGRSATQICCVYTWRSMCVGRNSAVAPICRSVSRPPADLACLRGHARPFGAPCSRTAASTASGPRRGEDGRPSRGSPPSGAGGTADAACSPTEPPFVDPPCRHFASVRSAGPRTSGAGATDAACRAPSVSPRRRAAPSGYRGRAPRPATRRCAGRPVSPRRRPGGPRTTGRRRRR